MKDDRLEKEFDEYFKGVNISNDITADAKKSVKPKRTIVPRIVKFASIAASIVLVFIISLTVMLKNDFKKGNMNNSASDGATRPDDPNEDNSQAPGFEGDKTQFVLYTDSDLNQVDANVYSLSSLDLSLKLIENFAIADNASVVSCKAAYKDDKLALVTAEVSILSGLNRDETTVFVEFTDERQIYYALADYYDGKIYNYRGAQYYLTATTAQNGEPEYKLHVSYNGVKYYFSVQSSDTKSYEKYLKLVTKNNF